MAESLSAVIITLNAGAQLKACLDSVAFAGEIVLVDSGSNDDTLEIARAAGARIFHQDWLGFGRQKQFAVERANNDWVLCIDADERVSDVLRASIQAELVSPRFHAYEMPRRNRFMGCWLRHGEGYPDLSLRLFRRTHARWSDDTVHEKVICEGTPGRLRGDLLHESHTSLDDYVEKQNRYTTLQAQALYARGTRARAANMLVNPLLRFVKFYIFRLGFLDGIAGFTHISIGCFNTFLKYAKLRELQNLKK